MLDRQRLGASAEPTGLSSQAIEPVPVSPVPASIPCAEKHEQRLADLAALEPNWNSYRARRISPYVIERSRSLINLAESLGLQPWITPLSDGGIQLERAGEDDWTLEILPNGSFEFHVSISCTWRAKPNADETAKLFLEFAAHHVRSAIAMEARQGGNEVPSRSDDSAAIAQPSSEGSSHVR